MKISKIRQPKLGCVFGRRHKSRNICHRNCPTGKHAVWKKFSCRAIHNMLAAQNASGNTIRSTVHCVLSTEHTYWPKWRHTNPNQTLPYIYSGAPHVLTYVNVKIFQFWRLSIFTYIFTNFSVAKTTAHASDSRPGICPIRFLTCTYLSYQKISF